MSVTAQGARPYPDKWARESATPLVERYHSAVRALAAEKFEPAGCSWEEAVEAGRPAADPRGAEQIEADVLAEGYRFDVSATISLKEEPDKYKPLAGITDSGEQESDEQGRKIVGTGDNVFKAPADITGTARYISDVDKVMEMLTEGVPENTVAIIDDSGGTLTAPILGDFTAVVCMGGTVRSHLGILTREYNVPCLMNATVDGLADGDRSWSSTRSPRPTPTPTPTRRRTIASASSRSPRGGIQMPIKRSYVELLETNNFIQKWADSFYFQCTTRTVQESKLFPVNPYITMSYYNAWFRYPEVLRKVDAAMPAEEIGDRARQVGTYVNTISMDVGAQFYLGGRQWFLDMGLLKPTDAVEDVVDVIDFHRRLNMSFHRAENHIMPIGRQPQRPDPHRAADRVLRRAGDRGDPGGQAPHRVHRLHGGGLGVRVPQPLRVPAVLLQQRSLPDQGRQPDAGPRRARPLRVRLPLDGRGGLGDREQQPDHPGDHEGHRLQHGRRLGQLRGLAVLRQQQPGRGRTVHLGLALRRVHPGAHGERHRAGRILRRPAREDGSGDGDDVEDDGRLDPRADDRRGAPGVRGGDQGRRPLRRRLRAGRLVPGRRPHPADAAADERRVRQLGDRRAGRADLAHLAGPRAAPHGAVLARAGGDVVLDPVLGARRRQLDRGRRADRPGLDLAAGENGEVDDDPGQADPGRVQRGGESVPLLQVRPAACTTTTSG